MNIAKAGLILGLHTTLIFASASVVAAAESNGFCQSASCQSEFNQLEKMAYYGSGDAATLVAVAYATASGVEHDVKKARRHIKQAVKWRNPMGMHQMSVWLRQGFIYEQDIARADELLERAANAKYGPALTDRAKLLLIQNTPEADKQAIALLEQADEQYYSPGRYLLAQLLVSGVAVESDLARAGRLYKNLAIKGYADSRQQLDKIIAALEQTAQQSQDNKANAAVVAKVQPLLADLKQINDIEVFKVSGQQFSVNSEFSNIVAHLDGLNVFNRTSSGSRIPGNICGRGTFNCIIAGDTTMGGLLDRSSVFTFSVGNFKPYY